MVYQPKRHYSWGGRNQKVSAQLVGEHFEKLEAKYGAVTKENFLQSATPEDSPMHKLFEWDNEKAAGLYRLQQANVIINSIRVEVKTDDKEIKHINAYVNTEPSGNGNAQFISIHKAMSDTQTKEHVISEVIKDLNYIKSKYERFLWFADVVDTINKFIENNKAV
jgi:hypothetical protein